MNVFFEKELEEVPEEDRELVLSLLIGDWSKH